MEIKDIQMKLDELKSSLEVSITEKQKAEIALQLKSINEDMKALQSKGTEIDEIKTKLADAEKAMAANQPVIDAFVKSERKQEKRVTTFTNAFAEAVEAKFDDVQRVSRERGKVVLDLKNFVLDTKTVGTMTLGGNLTGDQVASYVGVGIKAGDSINLRDIIPASKTATGLAVSYRETGGEGGFGVQTEGNAKSQIDYDLTEVKVVQRTIAGWARISEQMLADLPFLQTSVSRMLLRDFYKNENRTLYATLSSSANATAINPSGTGIAQKLLNMVIKQRENGYTASFALITYADYYTLLTTAYPSSGTEYSLPFGYAFNAQFGLTCLGTPVIPAAWVTESDVQICDANYVERVEVKGLSVTMSTEDSDNFTKNLVTFKAECREDINVLLKNAHLL